MRAYASLSGPDGPWQVHYREAGNGPALVMLHPSPLSSAALQPQIAALCGMTRCIAWDTPGYGASDPLPLSWAERDLSPYVAALAAFLDALQLSKPLIYGSATGAQIAIAFATCYPKRCAGLLLENVALFSDDECKDVMNGYFPALTPSADGGHLQQLWNMAARSTRFFPWQSAKPSAERRSGYADPNIVNSIVRDYLLAGSDYERAYRAAFDNERLDKLQALEVPTTIMLWEDGILGEYAKRLNEADLPVSINLECAGSGMDARMQMLKDKTAAMIRDAHNKNANL